MDKQQRQLEGIVVSDKMQKTRVVAITLIRTHPKYLKQYQITRKFKAHDEENKTHTGDKVTIQETRPLSKTKRWMILGYQKANNEK